MSKGKILVVEDNNIVAKDIQGRLQKLEYDIAGTAKSGQEAIEKATATLPDLILMDIKLRGEMDGVEAAREIRARLDIPVVYLTAYADEKTLTRAKITEPFGYIVKPFDENVLHINIAIALFKHEMEKKLKESEKWFATTLKCIGEATIATDAEGYIKFMNPVAVALTRWELDDALGQHWRNILQVVDEETRRPLELPDWGKDPQDGAAFLTDRILMVDKMGADAPVELTAAPIVDDPGSTRGIVLVFKEISERKVAEEALEQSHRLLQAVLEGTSDVIFLRNLEGRFIMINAAGARVLGCPETEIIGKTEQELFGPGTASLIARAHEEALATGETQTFECGITSDGVERTYLVSEEVCRSSDGNPVGVIGIARDITEVRIERRPLKQQDKLAKTGRTVGHLAHEMGQSLSSIKESLPAVKDSALKDPESRQQIGEIENELSRISGIVRQMSALYWRSRNRRASK